MLSVCNAVDTNTLLKLEGHYSPPCSGYKWEKLYLHSTLPFLIWCWNTEATALLLTIDLCIKYHITVWAVRLRFPDSEDKCSNCFCAANL